MLKVCWATDYFGEGNAYGFSVHNKMSRKAMEEAGVVLDNDAEVAVHVAPAHLFEAIEGKRNILYMAWDAYDLPQKWIEKVSQAEVVAVSAKFLIDVVHKYLPEKRVRLCYEGVDSDFFEYRGRRFPKDRPFRFLWVGAPNARKGWELVRDAWKVFSPFSQVELYVKTTMTDKLLRKGNVIWDSRNISLEELRNLYWSSHCFLFPSFGEGFGLTMAEAMSTGLPVIYTPWTAMKELATEYCGYPLKYDLIEADIGVVTKVAQADRNDLVATMTRILKDYKEARGRGRRASIRMCQRFTWEKTGERLKQIIAEVMDGKAAVN